MTQSSKKVESLIKSTFALQIAARCSADVEAICRKNSLSFVELLRPFSIASGPFQLKDVQGHQYAVQNVHVKFSEPLSEPVPESKLRLDLGNRVKNTPANGQEGTGNTSITPWYEVYRDTFLDHLKQSDHETIKHYVSAVMVVSSTDADPLESFSKLFVNQKQAEQSKYPKWLTPHVFYYYVLLHDISEGGEARAKDNFEKVKALYGAGSCFYLQINSRPPGSTGKNESDLWSEHLGAGHEDVDTDEVDGRFKLKFKTKNTDKSTEVKTSKNSPPLLNNEHQPIGNIPTIPEIIDPKNAREEATLFSSSGSDSSLISPHSLVVAPGNDPLTGNTRTNKPPVIGETISHALSTADFMADEQARTLSQVLSNGANEVKTNSLPAVSKYGQYLSIVDRTRVRDFVQELGRRLLVHLCEVLKNLNEWLLSRRSVRRSISIMSSKFVKMLQGPSNSVADNPTYATSSLEIQMRQLADIAFLTQSYDLAFQSYHHVKKDFQSASAWWYYSAAVEMCAVSAYMMSSTKKEVVSYMEEAISVYNLSCKAHYYALRSSLILSEILKERGLFRELTQLYIRMTTEDADLRSALCLEQAAYAFLRIQPSMTRKYALHLILAGHRFARSTQRVHSTRVYRQALEAYSGKGWTLAEDYIHFSLARHSFTLHRLLDAKAAFEALLSHESSQSSVQQLLNLKEYIFVYKQVLSAESARAAVTITPPTSTLSQSERVSDLPLLPLPFVKSQLTRVTFLTSAAADTFNRPHNLDRCGDSTSIKLRSGSFGKHVSSESSDALVPNHDLASKSAPDLSQHSSNGPNVSHSSSSDYRIRPGVSHSGSSSNSSSSLTLGQYLNSKQQQSGSSLTNLIIGASDYDPSKMKATKDEWEELEIKAAAGIGGVLHENFHPTVVMMDETTDNSTTPFCVVNEPIAVGLVLKNPLRIPLLMANLTLTWKFSSSLGGNPSVSFFTASSDAPPTSSPPEANCEVIESVVLKPGEEKMVTLHITPLKEGQLQVLGFLYNLCVDTSQTETTSESSLVSSTTRPNLPSMAISSQDVLYQKQQGTGVPEFVAEGIQGRVEIDIHGLRLNNTKTERAGVMYGSDQRLRWIVTSPMPKIVACLTCLPVSVYSGEVCRVGVEVYNCGQVPLNSLRLTSSLGEHILIEKECVSSSCGYPVYPSSLLSPINHSPHPTSSHPLPVTPSRCIEFPLPNGRLEPGQGVGANLVMRGASSSMWAGSGEIPWNILFYYEPALLTANSRLSHRVLHHSCVLKVKESLYLKTTAVHGQLPVMTTPDTLYSQDNHDNSARFDMNRVLVTIEAENRCQLSSATAAEVRVTQVSCVSREWSIKKMDRRQGLLCLHPNESGVVQLKASRLDEPSLSLCHSDVPLGPTVIPSNEFPTCDLLRGSESFKALQLFKREGASPLVNKEREKTTSDRIALVVFWQALVPGGTGTLFSYGHQTITVKLPQSMSALSEASPSHPPSPYDLIKFYLEHPVTHPYPTEMTAGMCQIPVSVVLQNCCHSKVKCMVELLQPKDGTQEQKKHIEPSFFWSGGTCSRQISLDGNSTRTITVYANFGKPGMYNLNTLRVLVAKGDSGNYHVQRWQRTSYITIE